MARSKAEGQGSHRVSVPLQVWHDTTLGQARSAGGAITERGEE